MLVEATVTYFVLVGNFRTLFLFPSLLGYSFSKIVRNLKRKENKFQGDFVFSGTALKITLDLLRHYVIYLHFMNVKIHVE